MKATPAPEIFSGSENHPPPFRELIADCVRYWEPRRLSYNAWLAAVTLGWGLFTWPHFRSSLDWRHGVLLLVLAALANACYCAAYPVDLLLQRLGFGAAWKHRRWLLWIAGMSLAILLANYWIADEIYPDAG